MYPGSKVTVAESLLLTMGHSLRHDASREATESLLNLLHAHVPEGARLPTSKYTFFKHFNGVNTQKARHFYCSSCSSYLGPQEQDAQVACDMCKTQHQVPDLVKNASFFFVFDFGEQIRYALKTGRIKPAQNSATLDISDIRDSAGYRKLPTSANDISLTFTTDGVSLFESSSYGIWLLLAQINELKFEERASNIILARLWFGNKKPALNTFLLPFVLQMNELSSNGIKWEGPEGCERITKVYPGPCTVDSVARCEVMGMTQFNGKHGCAWCEIPGEVVPRGNAHCRVYPVPRSTPKLRTNDSFINYAHKARAKRQKTICGVKGISVLKFLNYLTFCSGFVVDYMHAVCSGFVKATTMLWLNAKASQGFYLRDCFEEVDKKLLSIRPIWEMGGYQGT